MGKGAPASLAMASVRSALRCYAEFVPDLSELASRVNRLFCHDSETGEFATLFFCVFDPDRSSLHYCNCGHEPPLVMRTDGTVEDLERGGMILGVQADTRYEVGHLTLHAGDLLVMYTDGLAEAVNFARESFGRPRIIDALAANTALPARQIAGNLLWTMRKFTGLTPRYDDTALVVVKRVDADA